MTFPSANQQNDPTSNTAPILTDRASKNFYVTPMGKGRNARQVQRNESEDETESGVGMSVLGSILGSALGLGPMFEIGFEAMKSAMEISEAMEGARSVVTDVNLNPAALLRPELAFNFKSFQQNQRPPIPALAKLSHGEEETAKKRSWSSGEGDFLLAARLAESRRRSVASNPVSPVRGVSPSDRAGPSGSRASK